MNFLFDGSDGRRYIGTAGHCELAENGEASWAPGEGPVAQQDDPLTLGVEDTLGVPPAGSSASSVTVGAPHSHRIGEVAYALYGNQLWEDFALVRLDRDVASSAAMCHFGGPTGVYVDTVASPGLGPPLLFRMYGQGLGFGGTTPARTFIGQTPYDRNMAWVWGPFNFGDSGSAVILSDGRAVGWLTSGVVPPPGLLLSPLNGFMGITRIGPAVAQAEKKLGITLTLMTAPAS